MKTALRTAGLLALVSISSAALSQSIVDGSFEKSNVDVNAYQYSSDEVGNWWYQAGGPTLADLPWTFSNTSGIIGVGGSGPWGGLAPEDGSYYAFVQSYSGATAPGTISQTVSGFIVGDSYALTFFAAGRPSYSANTVTVGAAAASPDASMAFTPTTGNWQAYALDFTASNTTETLSWAGQPLPTDGSSMDNDTFIDNVSLAPAGNVGPASLAAPGPFAALPFLLGVAGKARRRKTKA